MIIYSIPMILCLIFSLIKLNDKNTKKAFYGIIFFLFIISGIRYYVGQDYYHWTYIYDCIATNHPHGEYVEIGYKYLNLFIQNLPYSNVFWLYLITSAFIIFGFGYAIKKNVESKYLFVSVFIFISSGIFFATLNLIRQYLAIVIILLGLKNLKNNKYIKFSIIILLASLFHTSALIMVPFMFFYIMFKNNKYNDKLIILYIISLIFIVIDIRYFVEAFSFIIPGRWKWYLDSEFMTYRNYSAIVKQLVPNILLIFTMINRKKIIQYNKDNDIYILLFYINVIITNCFYGVLVLLRFSYFFDISLVFVIPLILKILDSYDINIKRLGNVLIWGYYALLIVVIIFFMNGHGVMPYKTIFSIFSK